MALSIVDLISEEEILKIVEPEIQAYAQEIAYDLYSKSLEEIMAFYSDYSPRVYSRSYAMPGIVENPQISNNGRNWEITINFNGGSGGNNSLGGVHSKGQGGNIFDGPFVQGYHGPPWGKGGLYPAPRMFPSPWVAIRDYAVSKYNASVSG